VVAPGNPKHILSAADLARPGIRLINREEGAGSRRLLDAELKRAGVHGGKVTGYGNCATGHLPAAWHVHAGLADCCVATRAAARAFGLSFLPLISERYDFVLRKEHLHLATAVRLLDVLAQARLRRELEEVGGYDTRNTGQRII